MVFAGQKLVERKLQGKDTVFTIRGGEKPANEVERYWKRRQIQPRDLSPVPSTPPDVKYGTPAPCTPEASAFVDMTPWPNEATPSPYIAEACGSGNGFNEDNFGQASWFRPILLPPLTSPGHLRSLESILRGTRDFCDMCMDRVTNGTNLHIQSDWGRIKIFWRSSLTVILGTGFGYEASAQAALIRSQNVLPKILGVRDPAILPCIMDLLSSFLPRTEVRPALGLLYSAVTKVIATYSASHPLVGILRAMGQAPEMILPFAQVLLQVLVDSWTVQLGAEYARASDAFRSLQSVCWSLGDYTGALRVAETRYESYHRQHTLSGETTYPLMGCLSDMANCHISLGNYEKAARLVENGLTSCETHTMEAQERDRSRFYFLRLRADLRQRRGLPGAAEALEEALTIRRRWHEADDALAMDTAQQLQDLLDWQEVRE